MAFITITCPVCGGQAQIEAGRNANCPYCGNEMSMPADAGFAFAPQEMQAEPDPQFGQDLQFAQPSAQPLQFQQTAAANLPQVQPNQAAMQMPQYSPAMLAAAQQKRKTWHILNASLMGVQAFMMAFGILFATKGFRIGVPLILLWVLSTFGFGLISGMNRPDEAYIDQKPFNKTKFGAGVTQFWMGTAISAAVGGILFAMLAGLLGMY